MTNEQTTPDEDEQDEQDDTPFLDFHSSGSAFAEAMRLRLRKPDSQPDSQEAD